MPYSQILILQTTPGWRRQPKTSLSRRVIPVPPQTIAALRTHRKQQHEDRLAAGAAWRETGLVFTTHAGGPLEPRNVNRSWYAVRSRAALDGTRIHDLRHSCASFLLAAGASPRTVMKTLGYSQIGLTMNTYTHVLPELEREAIDAARGRSLNDRVRVGCTFGCKALQVLELLIEC